MSDVSVARDRNEVAAALVVLKVLEARIKAAREVLTAESKGAWQVGDRSTATLPGGGRVGSVTFAKGRDASARVVDERAFLAWVSEHAPTEVETVTRVRPAYQGKLLAEYVADGGVVDTATGEVADVPGVELGEPGDPYLTVRPDKGADGLVAEAWRSGVLDPREALQLGVSEPDGRIDQ